MIKSNKIDGPGVEPFAYYVYFPDAHDGEFCDDLDDLIDRMTNERHEVTPLFSASPSAPVARCHECGKLASEGWALYCVECAEKIAPAQAVPDDWQLVPKEPTSEMLKAAVMERHGMATYRCVSTKGVNVLEEEAAEDYRAMLASAPQPPSTAQPSAVACR